MLSQIKHSLTLSFLVTGLALCPAWSATFEEHMTRAADEFYRRDFNDAIQEYDRALKLNPGNPHAEIGRANALFEKGDLAQAQAAVQRLSAQHPEFPSTYLLKGRIFEQQGNRAAAKEAFSRYVQLLGSHVPQDPALRLKLREYGVY